MRDADDSLNVTETPFKHLVAPDFGHVAQSKERMIGEDDLDAECPGVEDALHSLGTQGSVSMEYINLLSQQDVPDVRKSGEEARKGRVNMSWRQRMNRNVVDFDAVG